jgi:hypothetical protein
MLILMIRDQDADACVRQAELIAADARTRAAESDQSGPVLRRGASVAGQRLSCCPPYPMADKAGRPLTPGELRPDGRRKIFLRYIDHNRAVPGALTAHIDALRKFQNDVRCSGAELGTPYRWISQHCAPPRWSSDGTSHDG